MNWNGRKYYDPVFEKRRKEKLETPSEIIRIALLKGYFQASLRYRDDWLRQRCNDLVAKKLLKRLRGSHHGFIVYEPTELAKVAS